MSSGWSYLSTDVTYALGKGVNEREEALAHYQVQSAVCCAADAHPEQQKTECKATVHCYHQTLGVEAEH